MGSKPESRKSERQAFNKTVAFELNDRKRMFRVMQEDALVIDISSGGLGVAAECELEPGAVVKVAMPAGRGEVVLPVLAEVVWSKPAGRDFRAGLRFLA